MVGSRLWKYDARGGCLLTQDPIGLAGGVNLYAYAGNNPVSFSDPFGLSPCTKDTASCPSFLQRFVDAAQTRITNTVTAIAQAGAELLASLTPIGDAFTLASGRNADGSQASAGTRALAGGMLVGSVLGEVAQSVKLVDGMKLPVNAALDAAIAHLGEGYKDMGGGRYLSSDGLRQVRIGAGDIAGSHGGGPHINLEWLAPNPDKPGKNMIIQNFHVYLEGN